MGDAPRVARAGECARRRGERTKIILYNHTRRRSRVDETSSSPQHDAPGDRARRAPCARRRGTPRGRGRDADDHDARSRPRPARVPRDADARSLRESARAIPRLETRGRREASAARGRRPERPLGARGGPSDRADLLVERPDERDDAAGRAEAAAGDERERPDDDGRTPVAPSRAAAAAEPRHPRRPRKHRRGGHGVRDRVRARAQGDREHVRRRRLRRSGGAAPAPGGEAPSDAAAAAGSEAGGGWGDDFDDVDDSGGGFFDGFDMGDFDE